MSCMSYISYMSSMTYMTCMLLCHTPYVCISIWVSIEALGPQECSKLSNELENEICLKFEKCIKEPAIKCRNYHEMNMELNSHVQFHKIRPIF